MTELDVLLNKAKDYFSFFQDKGYRETQKASIKELYESDRRIRLLNAPPGSGKSLIGMVMGYLAGGCVYLCSSKALQDQLEEEFPEAEKIRGRSNYPCLRNRFLTAAECIPNKKDCEFYDKCPYRLQKERVVRARFKILNYAYYITEVNYVGEFKDQPLVICDEADVLENIIVGFVKLRIYTGIVKQFKLGAPKFKTSKAAGGIEAWKAWAAVAREKLQQYTGKIQNQLVGLYDELENSSNVEKCEDEIRIQTRRKNTLNSTITGLTNLLKYADDTWLWERNEKYWEFKPVWLTEQMTNDFFLQYGKRFIFMSGTQPPLQITSKVFDIPAGDFEYMEAKSSFPIENRQIILRPSYSLTRDTMNISVPDIKRSIKEILDDHPTEKGIIHTISYNLAKIVMDTNSNRLLLHDQEFKNQVMDVFVNSDKPYVLVSPTIMRGVNLKDDLCRFIIWAKAPFLNLGDDVTKARAFSGQWGNLWYKSETAQSLVQGAGRGVRHEDDWCITYVLDEKAIELIMKNPKLFPIWFRDAMVFE